MFLIYYALFLDKKSQKSRTNAKSFVIFTHMPPHFLVRLLRISLRLFGCPRTVKVKAKFNVASCGYLGSVSHSKKLIQVIDNI